MKYFKREWSEEVDAAETDRAHQAYLQHLRQIEERLSSDLRKLATDVSLHDALFKAFDYDDSASVLEIRLRCGDLQVGYFDLDLHYEGACIVNGYTPALAAAVHNPKTEVLYDEVDVADGSLFEHRMLLWPQGDVTIRFRHCSLSYSPVTSRYSS